MRFKTLAGEFGAALSRSVHALSPRTTMPILEGVLVEATAGDGDGSGRLTLVSTDGTMTITATVRATVEEGGRIVLPLRLTHDIVRRLPEAELRATLSEKGVMSLRCLDSKTSVSGTDASFFPERGESDAARFMELPQPLIRDMLRQTAFAMSTDESRKILTGTLMEVSGGELRLVALDGFQMAIRSAPAPEGAPEIVAVLPGRFAQELSKLLGDDPDSRARFAFGEKRLTVSIEGATIETSLLDGEYIKYRNILPTEWKTRLSVDRAFLSECVDRASLMAREAKNNIIKLSISGGVMGIRSESEIGQTDEEVGVEQEGEDLEIGFNVRYVSDALKAIDDERISLSFISPIRPCVVKPAEGDGFTYVLLPLRIVS